MYVNIDIFRVYIYIERERCLDLLGRITRQDVPRRFVSGANNGALPFRSIWVLLLNTSFPTCRGHLVQHLLQHISPEASFPRCPSPGTLASMVMF